MKKQTTTILDEPSPVATACAILIVLAFMAAAPVWLSALL